MMEWVTREEGFQWERKGVREREKEKWQAAAVKGS